MTERSFNRALRQCRRALQTCNIETHAHSRRSFASSAQRQGTLPHFEITSGNEPLSSLLAELRRKIFIPAALNRPQRNLVFKTRHRAMLLSDPVTVEVGGEDHVLESLDVTKDIPDSWKSLVQAMQLMGESRQDWSQLAMLLAALRRSGRKWKDWQWERIVRKAGDAGMVEEVLQVLRQADTTGCILANVRLVREVMWACRERAVRSGWNKTGTERALRCAVQVAEMLEEKVHSREFSKGVDPRMQMDVIGLVLELAAVKAQKHQSGQDVDGKVEMYVRRLLPNFQDVGVDFFTDGKEGLLAARADYELLRWVPVWQALKISKEVLGEAMPQRDIVHGRLDGLEKHCKDTAELVSAADEANVNKRKGLKWFREVDVHNG